MRVRVQDARQEGNYYYTGYVKLHDLADNIRGYAFEKEVLDKAVIHKKNMEGSVPVFTVTFRMGQDASITEVGEDLIFETVEYEIRDGKSRAAAVLLMEPHLIEEGRAAVKILLVSEEKMAKLEKNEL
ncbi:hypothetical protein [Lactonifactor longoviformis]|uniref:hypothetical protein n=1 Tax=Lactonifactor longoviformis TaxID=341220 RepID=UPI001D0068F2|nr:hypothetical protein [Lactonifactor longoviformis]MCB5714702.1 hypothetical protein [Lactonifactor longoviformis]MCB5718656.1 hypothetical protein [Lactonifactor longoviformis]